MVVGLVCTLIMILKWEDLWDPVVFAEVVFCLSSTVCLSYWGLGCFVHQDPDVIVSPWHLSSPLPSYALRTGGVCVVSPWRICEGAHVFDLRSHLLP